MKRFFDFTCAALGLLLLAIPFLLLVWRVRRELGSPVFFCQMRPGLHGRPFRMIKFRTMTDARASDGRLLPDADRLTAFGRFLRASSLDELPELWNVLKGDMSLVGPRPLLVEYLPLYSRVQARRHDVRPGITGWAQVNGWRGETNTVEQIRKRVEHDLYYIEHWSIALDLRIIARTVVGGFTGHNAF